MLKLILFIYLSLNSFAQDEWFFNDLIDGKVQLPEEKKLAAFYKGNSKFFNLDISGDGVGEILKFQMIDGIPNFSVYNYKKEILYTKKFEIKGFEARPFKIYRKKLSNNYVVTLIYLFEGKTGYLEKMSTASLYANVVDNSDLSKIEFKKIASIWVESQKDDNYYRRLYNVNFEDRNNDGVKDLVIHSGKSQRTLYYTTGNNWIGI